MDSPLYEPLKAIGFEDRAIRSIINKYDHQVIARWAQYTQVAMETKGEHFFKKSPQAYCVDGIKRGTSAPDWYIELRREETRRQHDDDLKARGVSADDVVLTAGYRKAKQEALRKFLHEEVDRERYHKTVETFLGMFKDCAGRRRPRAGDRRSRATLAVGF